MTQEITPEQAGRIFDLESYKTVTGFKRFKRTAEEMNLGLSPEDALQRRLASFQTKPATIAVIDIETRKPGGTGEIVIRVRPARGVDRDYFEHLPKGEIVVEEDGKFYGWLDVKLGGEYSNNVTQFFADVLDQGLGELIDHPIFIRPEESNVHEDSESTPTQS